MKAVHEHISRQPRLLPATRILLVFFLLFLVLPPALSRAGELSAERRELLEQELFEAVWNDQPQRVSAIINEGIDPNTTVPLKNNAYRTLLYDATYKGFTDVVKVLLERGADPNAQNSNGKTALHLAAQRDMAEILELLLNARANPDLRSEDGSTPLVNAAFDGHTGIAGLLIASGADVNAQTDRTGRTALHIAAKNGHIEFIRLLFKHGVKPDIVDAENRTALGLAAMSGNTATTGELLEHGAAPDVGEPPLLYAARGGYEPVVRLLIEHKADIDRSDANGTTALMEAVRGGHADTERLLVQQGANTASTDLLGRTALHHASNGKTTELLLLYKADVDPRDAAGNTPLYLAAERARSVQCLQCEEKAQTLTQFKADILAKNNEGAGIIHAAAVGGLHWLLDRCLNAGADIDARDNIGRTPLHYAVSQQRPSTDLIRYLIDGGADVNARDNKGETPLDLATELPPMRGKDVIQLLIEHGAQSSMTLKPAP